MSHSARHAANGGTTSIKLGDRKAILSEIAASKSRSVHYLVLEAVDHYLTRETARLDFLREANDSLRQYHETGLHTSSQDMDAWMDSLFSDSPLPAPSCQK